MEMENHHQYGGSISDLRQFISIAAAGGGPSHFPTYGQQPQQQPSLLSDFMTAHNHHPYNNTNTNTNTNGGMVVMGRHMGGTSTTGPHPQNHYQDHFNCDSATTTTTNTTAQGNPFDCGDGGTARWPRQETLTLLEVRSRLDHKFKEANQKGPLWDEVARIMCEEHGYQRSGKKCREKFENLYKYYKKTKEGKAGRQDGKHYRFFRQLEALYGEHHNPISTSEAQNTENTPQFHNTTHSLIPPQPITSLVPPPSRGCDTSVSLSNSSNFDTSSSDDEDGSMESNGSMETQKKKKKKRKGHGSNWKAKIKEFIDLQMRKIMEKQESWLEKMMNTLENRENERMIREEEWRKQEVERVEREHKFWASERAWIEARDSALMAALDKITNNNNNNNNNNNDGVVQHQWPEHEVTRLIQVRTSMESRFQQCGFSEEVLWEDIATKMAYLGYDRSAIVCKEKWDNINNYFRGKSLINKDEGKKKRKENYGGIIHQHHNHHHNNNNNNNHGNEGGIYMNQLSGFNNCEINEPIRLQLNEGSSSPSSHNSNVNANTVNAAGNVMNDSCLRFFLGDHAETNLGWESNYGLKLNNGDNNHCP